MSNLLQQYAQQERQMQQIAEQLEKMKSDPRLKAEIEFKNQLEALMKEYDKSSSDVLGILDPASVSPASQPTAQRRKRKLKIYENPNTGEVVETRGGNQKTLKAWKDEHGDETVESWLVRTED
ncbi:DNA binding protein [Billgrantia diversa]|uniref:histone-like nucleoid-structuring protein, MvaT/MvaU family n=1 Tax=Halomonas sp. MCCC 1A13316 TaxID=2733487 RepID=UPI0018A4A6BC|nr:histone-like nucleoid-structuring protein, MvaT/MvaU family [Halomonas sp. MCCC 1A13316]QOR40219.1 DNA binding protein [Halomonas sp. MCCC 1A13316]